jgi:hypothetical protein
MNERLDEGIVALYTYNIDLRGELPLPSLNSPSPLCFIDILIPQDEDINFYFIMLVSGYRSVHRG